MTGRTSNIVTISTLLAIILGGILGYYVPSLMLGISFVGDLFLRALRVIVLPLMVAGIVAGIPLLGGVRRLGRPLVITLAYFLATTAVAVAIGVALATIILPGTGVDVLDAVVPGEVSQLRTKGFGDIVSSLIPTNVPQAVMEGQYVGIILGCLIFSGILATLGMRGKNVLDFFRGVNQVLLKVSSYILFALPVGLFSVVGTVVAKNAASLGQLSSGLGYYAITILAGLVLHAVVVLPLILKFMGRRSPIEYANNMLPALSTGLGTGSSVLTYPVAYDGVVVRNKVDNRAAAMALPLGTLINVNGTALQMAVAAHFVAQAFGISLSLPQILAIVGATVLVSLGSGLMPFAGITPVVLVLLAAGLPPESFAGIGVIIVIDWLLSRGRAVVDTWGNAVGVAVLAEDFSTRAPQHREQPQRFERPRPVVSEPREARPRREPVRDDRRGSPRPQGGGTEGRRDWQRRDRPRPDRDREPRRHDQTRDRRRPAPGRETIQKELPDVAARRPSVSPPEQTPAPEPRRPVEPREPAFESSEARRQPTPVENPPEARPQEREEIITPPPVTRSVDETATPVSSEEADVQFGRPKSRRGRFVREGESSEEPAAATETPAGQEEFPKEGITFGRQKKKQTR